MYIEHDEIIAIPDQDMSVQLIKTKDNCENISISKVDDNNKNTPKDSVHYGKNAFQCAHCKKSYSRKDSLKLHLQQFHNGTKQLQFKRR